MDERSQLVRLASPPSHRPRVHANLYLRPGQSCGTGESHRSFEFLAGSVEITEFVPALLAVELGDTGPVDRLSVATADLVGLPRHRPDEEQLSDS
ncbi:DUF6420 family protein [Streptomyces camponoticapitis]|uniref:DUF6420 family protein n=1 Tax=Streptomyces camponoticapitis TaxID=1616125 RepID=UPI003570E841